MNESYNNTPEACQTAALALLQRGRELNRKWNEGNWPLGDAIWNNMGFHGATALIQDAGQEVPTGVAARIYICLVAAAIEHAQAQTLFDGVLDNMPDEEEPS